MRLLEPRFAPFALMVPVLAALGGCSSTNDPVPACDECEKWFRISPVLGRYPSPHPFDRDFVLFSTVEKPDPTAPDAARQNDEDLWLTWIEDRRNEAANGVVGRSLFAITGDEMGTTGANTGPQWSPSGMQVAWVHAPSVGGTQIWIRSIQVPATRGEAPVLGAPVMVVDRAKDPAWLTEDRLLFTRDSKLYRIDVGGGTGSEEQLSFDPPVFTSTEKYIDRHPNASSDGAVVFGTRERLPVGDIYVQAFEVIPGGPTVPTDAFISFQSPSAGQPTFPVIELGVPLQTPHLLKSLPITGGSAFRIGASLSSAVVEDSLRENYCDTTIVVETLLQPDEVDTVSISFEIVRGSLRFVTEATNATIFWTREDGRASINDYAGSRVIQQCIPRSYPCLLPWAVAPDGTILVGVQEDYIVTATAGTPPRQETQTVTLSPGQTTLVTLFEDPNFACRETEPPRPRAVARQGGGEPGATGSLLRAPGDASNVWRLSFDANDQPRFQELLASDGLIQSPAITREYPGSVRYAAWVSDETGDWQLYVQRLVGWVAEGSPWLVRVPGTFDNLACTRNVFHPQWIDGSSPGALELVVTMTECPDNEFPDIGFDQDPWPIGELRVWTVVLTDYQ